MVWGLVCLFGGDIVDASFGGLVLKSMFGFVFCENDLLAQGAHKCPPFHSQKLEYVVFRRTLHIEKFEI